MLKVFGAVTADRLAAAACPHEYASPTPDILSVFRRADMGRRMKVMAMDSKLRLSAAVFAAFFATVGGCRQAAASPLDLTIDINGTTQTFTDVATPNEIVFANYTVGSVTVSGEFAIEVISGEDALESSSFNVVNTGSGTATVTAALSGQNFPGPVGVYGISGSGTWANSPGSVMTESWYYDPTNTLGGQSPTDTPGIQLASLSSPTAGGATDSFSMAEGGNLPVDTGPGAYFSMTEAWSYTLDGDGGSLTSRGQDEIALVPEPASVGMVTAGLLGLTLLRRKSGRV